MHIWAKKGAKEYTLAPLLKPYVIIYSLFVVYEQIVASCRNTVNKMQNQRYYFIPVYQKCQMNLVVGDKNIFSYLFYNASLTIISAKPSRFCPLHLSISSLLGSVIDNPMPHMQSLTAHSAKTASPVVFSLAFNSGF